MLICLEYPQISNQKFDVHQNDHISSIQIIASSENFVFRYARMKQKFENDKLKLRLLQGNNTK